jgi:hypothetical protein
MLFYLIKEVVVVRKYSLKVIGGHFATHTHLWKYILLGYYPNL